MVARAEFDFSAASDEEISLRAGDLINLAPKGDAGTRRASLLFVGFFLCFQRSPVFSISGQYFIALNTLLSAI